MWEGTRCDAMEPDPPGQFWTLCCLELMRGSRGRFVDPDVSAANHLGRR